MRPSNITAAAQPGARNRIIDLLRGIAIFLVLGAHFPLYWTGSSPTIMGRSPNDVRQGFGYYGVAIFFVISGFLITDLSQRRYGELRLVNPSQFWWMRFARIVPLLGLALLTMILFHFMGVPGFRFESTASLGRTVTGALSFRFPELLGRPDNGPWGPLWSLSIEEMFYLLFPLVALFITGWAAALWIGMVLISSAVYFRYSGHSPYSFEGCEDLLCVGCLIAYAQPRLWWTRSSAGIRRLLGVFCLAAGFVIMVYGVFAEHPFAAPAWSSLRCGIGAGLVLIGSQIEDMPPSLYRLLRPLCLLGVWSYEIYLVHAPALAYAGAVLGRSPNPWLILVIVVAASGALHAIYTEPINRHLRGLLIVGEERRWARMAASLGAVLAALAIAAGVAFSFDRPLRVILRIQNVAPLPAGASEPVIETGVRGAGDLVYLRHEPNGMLRLGIDHWGGPEALSKPIAPANLAAPFEVRFGTADVELRINGQIVVINRVGAFSRMHPLLAKNSAHFTTASDAATSSITLVSVER